MTRPPRRGSRLIEGLPPRQRRRVLAACDRVELVAGRTLCEAGGPMRQVYFPVDGFVSMLACSAGHPPLQVALIGSEGMLGATLALGMAGSAQRGIVRGGGSALRMSAARLRRVLRANPALQRSLQRYLFGQHADLARTATCLRFHPVQARLAQLLLAAQDRSGGRPFQLTHDVLAGMLGVRRSGVSVAAAVLQRRQLIRYVRGAITVLDRPGLQAASCGCVAEPARSAA